MSHYESQTVVDAEAKQVFEFVKDPQNMPKYLPTVHSAQPQGPGRVEVEGEAGGHHYDSDGWFKIDDQEMTMTWGSDGEHKYAGQLFVKPEGRGSRIQVSLDFEPNPGEEQSFKQQMGSRDATIKNGLDKSVQSIKNLCEGSGGKETVPADRG